MMKKITFIIAILMSSLSFSQEMPIDHEDANDTWAPFNGAATTIVDDNGNKVLQMVGAANAWDGATITFANLIDLSDDANNTISFRVMVPADSSHEHLLKFEENVGGNGPGATELTFNTSGTGWQTINVDFPAGLGQYGKMSVFVDKGDANASKALTYWFDDFAGGKSANRPAAATPPATAAATPPARNAWDVISLYSDAYTNVAANTDAGWCGGGSVENVMIAGNNTWAYKGNACQGIVLDNGIDASAFTHLHVDVYIAAGTDVTSSVFNLKFVQQPGGAAKEYNFNAGSSPALEAGKWISIDIPVDLTGFDGFKEFGVTCNISSALWYDNLYVYRAATASVENNELLGFSMYPNPSSNVLNISAKDIIQNADVFNVIGKKVKSFTINKTKEALDVSDLASGIYLIKYNVGDAVGTAKFIKE